MYLHEKKPQVIDLHTHILPETDDGSGSMKESISMVLSARRDGIRTIVATPHNLNGIYDTPKECIEKKIADLQSSLDKYQIPVNIVIGQENALCSGIAEAVASGDAVTLGDSGRYLLVELPFQGLPKGYEDLLFQLSIKGITPVIAHPERNQEIRGNMKILEELVENGSLVQVTARSITGELGSEIKKSVTTMLRHNLVHVIASDSHSFEQRPPVLSPAVAEAARILGNETLAMDMVTTVPNRILDGKGYTPREPFPLEKKKRFFLRFW